MTRLPHSARRGALAAVVLAVVATVSVFFLPGKAKAQEGTLSWRTPVPTLRSLPSDVGAPPTAVSCPTTSLCVAVDNAGDVVTSTNPAGSAPTWTVANVDGNAAFTAVSCPTISLCVAVDNAGSVATSDNPAGSAPTWTVANVDGNAAFTAVSCPTSSLCVAVDKAGDVVTSSDPTGSTPTWAVADVDGTNALSTLSCPTTSLCVASDGAGHALSSTDPTDASTWTVVSVTALAGGPLRSLSCASISLCVGVYEGDLVVTDDPVGDLWGFEPPTEGEPPIAIYMSAVSCTTSPSTLCTVFGRAATSPGGVSILTATDPLSPESNYSTPWSQTSLPFSTTAWTVGLLGSVADISCPAATFCAAVDSGGDVDTSTDPSSVRSWVKGDLDPNHLVLSCPSTDWCAAVNAQNQILTSSDPIAGSSAWIVIASNSAWGGLETISCPTTQFCLALSDDNDVVVSSDPASPDPTWTTVSIPSNLAGVQNTLTAVDCPSASLCVATDLSGDVFFTTDPMGGASDWTLTNIASASSGYLGSISCPTPSFCAAVGTAVVTSTDPTGGSSAWTSVSMTADPPLSFTAIACQGSSAPTCVATDEFGRVAVSDNPTGGLSAWTLSTVDTTGQIEDVSCPTTTLCVAADDDGNVLVSTDPTGGTSAWSLQSVDFPWSYLVSISCPNDTTCFIADYFGNVIEGTLDTVAQSTMAVSSPSVVLGSGSVTASVTLTGNPVLGTPAGTMAFSVCQAGMTQTLTPAPCPPSGANEVSMDQLEAGTGTSATIESGNFDPPSGGTWCFSAQYTSSSGYASADYNTDASNANPDACVLVTPEASTTTGTVSSDAVSIGPGGTVTDTATVEGDGGASAPTGTVTFFACQTDTSQSLTPGVCAPTGSPEDAGQALVGASGDTSSAQSTPFTPSSSGTWCFSATYSGDSNYGASSDNTSTGAPDSADCFLAEPGSSSMIATADPKTVALGSGVPITDTAVVTGNPIGGPPTGTVDFFVCGPTTEDSSCGSTATVEGEPAVVSDGPMTSTANSVAYLPVDAGTYCFASVFVPALGGSYQGSSNNASGPANPEQCSTVEVVYEITSAPAVTVTVGTRFDFPITTVGSPPPTVKKRGRLPATITFSDAGGSASISGVPTRRGIYHVKFTATFGIGRTKHVVAQAFTLNVVL